MLATHLPSRLMLTLCRLQMRKCSETQSRRIRILLSLIIYQLHHCRPCFGLVVLSLQSCGFTKRTSKIIRIHHFTILEQKTSLVLIKQASGDIQFTVFNTFDLWQRTSFLACPGCRVHVSQRVIGTYLSYLLLSYRLTIH